MGLGFRKRADDVSPIGDVDAISNDSKGEGINSTSIDVKGSQAVDTLKEFTRSHKTDPNLPLEELNAAENALNSGDLEKEIAVERALVEENSPYPEVRAAVRNYDVDLPCNTIRMWVIGMLLTTVGSGVNCLFSMRNPSIALTTYAVQLIAYPIGLLWDLVFPDRVFTIGKTSFNFKPGPFNFKEHCVIVVMANAAYAGSAIYATDTLIAQKVWYKQDFGWGFQILFALTTQMMGYGLAGVSRRWLVWPAAMIWPSALVNCSLFYTLHDHSPADPTKTGGWTIGRYRWFLYVMTGSFVWYWFPGWIFQGLSYFVFATWIAPNNVIVNQLFGGVTGLGLIPITFDWTIISGYLLSPLIPPWHAIGNTLVGLFIFIIISAIGIHYSGTWYADYLPMQDSSSYDNTASTYNVTRILTAEKTLDVEAYHAYSPLYLSTNFALCYGLSFAGLSSVIVHTILYNSKDIIARFKMSRNQEDDIHMRMAKKYADAPDWWYIALFVIMLALSFVTICVWDTHFEWWALIVCLIIPLVWTVPNGIIQAITNIQIGLNVITEFIVGYMLPGRPIAMMMFKTYGYITMAQALSFVQDLKMGHYMKIAPKVMFFAQVIASIWSCIIQIAVMNWALGAIPDICDPGQADGYTCPGGKVFYTASIIWGLIGPARIFSNGAIYSNLQYFWLVGVVMTVGVWLAARRWPKSIFRYAMVPVIFGGLGMLPPATVYVFLAWGIVGWVFQKYIRTRHFGWWAEYNYVTSAALDTGLILCTILIFFTLYLTEATAPQWWGNVAVFETMDYQDTAIRKVLAPGETFGPSTWN